MQFLYCNLGSYLVFTLSSVLMRNAFRLNSSFYSATMILVDFHRRNIVLQLNIRNSIGLFKLDMLCMYLYKIFDLKHVFRIPDNYTTIIFFVGRIWTSPYLLVVYLIFVLIYNEQTQLEQTFQTQDIKTQNVSVQFFMQKTLQTSKKV